MFMKKYRSLVLTATAAGLAHGVHAQSGITPTATCDTAGIGQAQLVSDLPTARSTNPPNDTSVTTTSVSTGTTGGFVQRDAIGPSPENAKRISQELVTRDKGDVLVGFDLTAEHARRRASGHRGEEEAMVIMNAATSIIATKSPYIVRVSMTLPQVTEPMAKWAAKNGVKKVYTMLAYNGRTSTRRRRLLTPSMPRAARSRVPCGRPSRTMKGYEERGLKQAGVKLIATGNITDDAVLQAMDNPTLGLITSFHDSDAHDSPQNALLKKAFAEVNGTALRPTFMVCADYDGMAAIVEALKKTGGATDGHKLVAAIKGMEFDSPRGPLEINGVTRDPAQTIYIARSRR